MVNNVISIISLIKIKKLANKNILLVHQSALVYI